ncbi:MAG: hypothetical protein KGJ90_00290 [Patescibacteria group bacterium]|nr:hypothetical protein [Patescibacteria group bacterium]
MKRIPYPQLAFTRCEGPDRPLELLLGDAVDLYAFELTKEQALRLAGSLISFVQKRTPSEEGVKEIAALHGATYKGDSPATGAK